MSQNMHMPLILSHLLPTRHSINGSLIYLFFYVRYWLATRHFYGVNYFRTLTLSLLRTDPLFLFPLPPSSFILSWIKASNSSFFCGESSGLERRSSIIQFPTHGRLSARSLSTFRVQAALRSVCQQQRQMVWKRTRPCEVTEGVRRFSLQVYTGLSWHVSWQVHL